MRVGGTELEREREGEKKKTIMISDQARGNGCGGETRRQEKKTEGILMITL